MVSGYTDNNPQFSFQLQTTAVLPMQPLFAGPECNFDGGSICIQTEKPYYLPGEQVNGMVYICVRENTGKGGVYVSGMDMSFKGKEKVAFNTFRYEGEEDNRRRVKDRHKKKHTFVSAKQRIANWEGGFLANGNYDLRFIFNIPKNAPSAVFFKDKHLEEKPKTEITYEIKAKLDCKFGTKDFKYS